MTKCTIYNSSVKNRMIRMEKFFTAIKYYLAYEMVLP